MDISSVELLEFERVRSECSSYCLSPAGRDLLAEQDFQTDPGTLDALLSLVQDFRHLLISGDTVPVVGFPDVSFLPLLRKEGLVLEGAKLAALGLFVRYGRKLKNYLLSSHPNMTVPADGLISLAEVLPDLGMVEKKIFQELDEEGNVREDHPALKKIRSRMRSVHADLTSLTSALMRDKPALWQMEGPVQREGRAVLPLKADYRGKLKGIVHETSSSGQTVYVEPFEMVDLNNEKAILESAYRNVAHTVAREISSALREYYEDTVMFVRGISYLDTLYARARYGRIHNCARALRSDGMIRLTEARHPHLGASAVPIHLQMDEKTRVMIVTGPNAGGKTVTLKTLGIFALMNQFGLEIPAAEGSELPVFDDVYADIGDDQSISASLSTFSGHMKRIAAILRYSTEKSLVLLDELGAGTDPAEGSSLAMALMDTFLDMGSTVVVTTHHGVLKQFAYTHPGVMNASLAFDRTTLQPTYRIIDGLPGESHGLEIAAKSGIAGEVIEKAEGYMEERKSDVSAAIEELEKQKRLMRSEERDLEKRAQEQRLFREQLEQFSSDLTMKERDLKERELAETNRFIRESRRELENLVRVLKEGELTKRKTAQVKAFKESLDRKAEEEEKAFEEIQRQIVPEGDYTPVPGDEVMIAGKRGTVLRQEKDGSWLVTVGSLKVAARTGDLRPASRTKDREKVSVSYSGISSGNEARFEMDMRGMRLEEALLCLEKQIDGAILSGLYQFHVIHGSGEGVLRQGVHNYLRQSPVVEAFEFSHPQEGGFGKTIVRLRQT